MASLEEIYGTGSPFKLPSSPIDTQRPGAILAQGLSQLPLMYLMLQQQKSVQDFKQQEFERTAEQDALRSQQFDKTLLFNENKESLDAIL